MLYGNSATEYENSKISFEYVDSYAKTFLIFYPSLENSMTVADDLATEEVCKPLEISELDDAIQGIHVLAIPVVEFSREGHKIKKIFGLE